MKPEDYPGQEPLSDFALPYHDEVMRLARSVPANEISYGDDPYQGLAWVAAENGDGTTLVMFHGGGWTSGYKEWMLFKAPAMTARGINFVTAGYRLAPQHTFPAGMQDCQQALAWVYRNCDRFGGDPDRIFVSGHSAGGHYASLMAVQDNWQGRNDVPADVIRGCLPVSGTFYFTGDSGLSMRPRFLGDDTDNDYLASPMHHIHNTLPFFIACGSDDFPHLKRQAREMAVALREAGTDVTLLELPGCDHLQASLACADPDGTWIRQVVPWMLDTETGNRS